MTTLERAAIYLSLASFVVTVVGFFASLIFYVGAGRREQRVDKGLVEILEKAQTIQSQVGSVFEKTLDAALGKNYELNKNLDGIEKQIVNLETLVAQVQEQSAKTGQQQHQRIEQTAQQVKLLKERIETTRATADEVADASIQMADQLRSRVSETVPQERPSTIARYISARLPLGSSLSEGSAKEIAVALIHGENPKAAEMLSQETGIDEQVARTILTKVNVQRLKDDYLRSDRGEVWG